MFTELTHIYGILNNSYTTNHLFYIYFVIFRENLISIAFYICTRIIFAMMSSYDKIRYSRSVEYSRHILFLKNKLIKYKLLRKIM